MFTAVAFALLVGLALAVEGYNRADRRRAPEEVNDAELRQSILHARQDLKMIAFLLGAILVMLGVVADRLH